MAPGDAGAGGRALLARAAAGAPDARAGVGGAGARAALGVGARRPAGEPEHDAFNDRTAQGGFWVPPALQKHKVELRASKLSEDARARFTPFPFEK